MAISPATNTPANVDNWYFLGGAAPRWNLPRTLKSRRALATAKFPGEIYRAACTGKCRGPVARFVAKIFATAFSMFSSRGAWYWRLMLASTRVDTRDTHKHTYTNMCIYTSYPHDDGERLSCPVLSPLFFRRINANVLIYCFSPSLSLPCQDSKSLKLRWDLPGVTERCGFFDSVSVSR